MEIPFNVLLQGITGDIRGTHDNLCMSVGEGKDISFRVITESGILSIVKAVKIQMAEKERILIHEKAENPQGFYVSKILIGGGDQSANTASGQSGLNILIQKNKAGFFDETDRKTEAAAFSQAVSDGIQKRYFTVIG